MSRVVSCVNRMQLFPLRISRKDVLRSMKKEAGTIFKSLVK